MESQDCQLCFYKFYNDSKKLTGWCYMFEKRMKDCKKFKNDIKINGETYHFINPLTEPCLDKRR